MPHAASWIIHVAFVPWDEVAVEMKDGLSGIGSAVHADVVAVGLMGGRNDGFGLFNDLREVFLLFSGEVKKIFPDLVGDDQKVAGRDGKSVFDDEEIIIPVQDFIGGYRGEIFH